MLIMLYTIIQIVDDEQNWRLSLDIFIRFN